MAVTATKRTKRPSTRSSAPKPPADLLQPKVTMNDVLTGDIMPPATKTDKPLPNTTYRKQAANANQQFVPACIPGWEATFVHNDPKTIAEMRGRGVHIVVKNDPNVAQILLDENGYQVEQETGYLVHVDCVVGVRRSADKQAELDDMIATARKVMNTAGEGTLTETEVPLDQLTPDGVAA